MNTVKVLNKGQIVIPASIRKKYNIHPGNALKIFEYGNLLYLVPPVEDPIQDAMGCIPKTPSMSKALLKERKEDFSQ